MGGADGQEFQPYGRVSTYGWGWWLSEAVHVRVASSLKLRGGEGGGGHGVEAARLQAGLPALQDRFSARDRRSFGNEQMR